MSFFGERYDQNTKDFMSLLSHNESSLEKIASAKEDLRHTNLFDELNQKYGKEWWDWEPETLVATINNPRHMDIIQAYQVILNTNQAHEHWHVFEKVGHAFNNNVVDFTIVQPLRSDEAALTLNILMRVRPKEVFDLEVLNYIACCAKHDGLVYLPREFFGKDVQPILDSMGNDKDLAARVESSWDSKKTSSQDDVVLDIQLKSLNEIKEYLGATNERI